MKTLTLTTALILAPCLALAEAPDPFPTYGNKNGQVDRENCPLELATNGNFYTYKGRACGEVFTSGTVTTIETVDCDTFEVTREARGRAEVGRKEI